MEQTHPYVYKSDEVRTLKLLRMSLAMKKKKNWSRETSPGFIAEDIQSIKGFGRKVIEITTPASRISVTAPELNLRETEECIKFLEILDATNRLKEVKAKYPDPVKKQTDPVPEESNTNSSAKSTKLVDGSTEKTEPAHQPAHQQAHSTVTQASLQVDEVAAHE